MTFTLASKPISRVRLFVPLDGVATAEVDLVDGSALTGAAILVIGDLTLQGVVSGAVVEGIGKYVWTAGAGLWETPIPAKGEQSSLGVLRSNVLTALPIAIAQATGGPTETLLLSIQDARLGGIGSAYARPAGPAWHTLRALRVPWWVNAAGVTVVGDRPSAPAPLSQVDLLQREPGDGLWRVAPRGQGYAAWLPGNTIGAEVITSFTLDATPGEPVTLTLTTGDAFSARSERAALDRVIAQNTDLLRFHGIYEYRVIGANRETAFDLRPVSSAIGLPELSGRELKPGLPGYSARLQEGQIVSLGFENGDPALPYIRGFEPRYKSVPTSARIDVQTELKLGDGTSLVARQNDPVTGISIAVASDIGTGVVATITLTDANGVSVVLTPAPGTMTAAPTGAVLLSGYKIGLPTQTKVRA